MCDFRFHGYWNAIYPDQPEYSGTVLIVIEDNQIRRFDGSISKNNVFDSKWDGFDISCQGTEVSLRYRITRAADGAIFYGGLQLSVSNENRLDGEYRDDPGGDVGGFILTRIGPSVLSFGEFESFFLNSDCK